MSNGSNSSIPRLDPIEGVLEILTRGRMTGTNKLGLLLVLLDLAPTRVQDNQPISLDDIADRSLEIHWPHGRLYEQERLRQSSAKKKRSDDTLADDTKIMQRVHKMRELVKAELPLEVVKERVNKQWKETQKSIEADLWRNPIDKLQNLPGDPPPFLYKTFQLKKARKIQFLPNVAATLTKFAGVLRPLIEYKFAEVVANINNKTLGTTVDQIHGHLFGSDRRMPPSGIRQGLLKIQNNRCIFSDKDLSSSPSSLDHVLPWSRIPLSHIENFVLTTPNINSSKSDILLAPEHLDKWIKHIKCHSHEIQKLAKKHKWPTDNTYVCEVAYSTYQVLSPSTGVWHYDRKNQKGSVQPIGCDGKAEIDNLLSVSR